MGLFGVCPETDSFSAVVCGMCNAVIKPQGLKSHMAMRHNYSSRKENYVTSNTSCPTNSGRVQRSSMSLINSNSKKPNVKQQAPDYEEEADRQITSNTITSKLGKRTHHGRKGRNSSNSKLIPIKDRDYTPDAHCGVLTGDPPKPCTRSLTCKSHTLHSRRSVSGRTKTFDKLLHEHKSSKSAVSSSTLDPDSESSSSNASSLNSASYDDTVTSTTNITTSVVESDNQVSSTIGNSVPIFSLPPPPPSCQSSYISDSSLSFSDSEIDVEIGDGDNKPKLCNTSFDEDSKSSLTLFANNLNSNTNSVNDNCYTSVRLTYCTMCNGITMSSEQMADSKSILPLHFCGKCLYCTHKTRHGPCCHGIKKAKVKVECGQIVQYLTMQCVLKCGYNVVVPICPKTNYKHFETFLVNQSIRSGSKSCVQINDSESDNNLNSLTANDSSNSNKIKDNSGKFIGKRILKDSGCINKINCAQLLDILDNIRLERERRIRLVQPQKIITKRFSLTNNLKHEYFSPTVLNMMAHALITKRSDQDLAILSVEIHVDDNNDIYLIASGVNDEHIKEKLQKELTDIIHTIHALIKINVFLNDNSKIPNGMSSSVYNKYKQIFYNTENITFNDVNQTPHLIDSKDNLVHAVLQFFKRIILDRQQYLNNNINCKKTNVEFKNKYTCKNFVQNNTDYNSIRDIDPIDLHNTSFLSAILCNTDSQDSTEIKLVNDLDSSINNNVSIKDESIENNYIPLFPQILTLNTKRTNYSHNNSNNSRRRDYPGIRRWFRTIPKPISMNSYTSLQRSGGGLILSRRLYSFRRSIQNNFAQNNNNIMMNRNQIAISAHINSSRNNNAVNNSGHSNARFYSIGFNRYNNMLNIKKVRPSMNKKIKSNGDNDKTNVKVNHSILRKLSNVNRLNKYFKKTH